MFKKNLSQLLLDWYADKGRTLPWRVKGGAHPNPYAVLVSEFMLQQTGVKTVIPYFERFMKTFPTVQVLAEVSEEEIYLHWQGLGYYSRARSLHATAREIAGQLEGVFPETKEELLRLKGIGPYTAASFLALAFNKPETVIDGNVIRVICRLYNLKEPAAEIAPLIRQYAEELADKRHPADYASAIMDLGATVCTPKKPDCENCPWREHCLAKKDGNPEIVPVLTRPDKKYKKGRVYLIADGRGGLFIRKRPGKGLLSGLYEFPWAEEDIPPFEAIFTDSGISVSHTFTHFKLELKLFFAECSSVPIEGSFVRGSSFGDYPFSTLVKKVYRAAVKNNLV